MNLKDEKELILSIKKDRAKFGLLFDVAYPRIFQYIMRRTGEYALSQDIAAETFLKAYIKISDFEWKNISVMSWLYRIATNEINSTYRKKGLLRLNHSTILNVEALRVDSAEDERIRAEEEFQQHAEFIRMLQAIKKLPVRYQEVIALRFFEELSISQISEILSKPEGTIKSLISRGLEKLRRKK
jgi:RNA polymerase sigma-70 factor (ECF subfamily)